MRYQQPYDQTNPNAPYVDGNPSAGIMGSIPRAAAIEHPQREIINAIQQSGLSPDASDLGQLWKAIQGAASGAAAPTEQLVHFGVDTGSANRLVSDVTPNIATYRPGALYFIKAAFAPSGPAIGNFDGRGDRSVVRLDGSAIQGGDWAAGDLLPIADDGDRLVLLRSRVAFYRGANTGSVNAITADVAPNPTQYETNAIYMITLSGPNTGPVTANLDNLGVKSVVRSNGNALRPGDISRVAALTYDGTNLVLLNLAQEIAPPGSGFTGSQQRFGYLPQTGVNSRLSASFTATFAGVVLAFSTLNSSPSNGNISNSATVSVNGTATTGAGDSISGASTSIASAIVAPGNSVTVSGDCQPSQSIQFPASQYLTYLFIPG